MPPPRLPPELVGQILRFLQPDVLRVAAAVSRVFRKQAWLAGLVIHRLLVWRSNRDCATVLSKLSEVVDHVVQNNLRLSLSLILHAFGPHGGAVVGPPASHVLDLIPVALPVLVRISLAVSRSLDCGIAQALIHQAPHLEYLTILRQPVPDPGPCSIPVLCADIFGGDAPKLRHVTLNNIHLPATPIAAFARVVSLTITGVALDPDIVLVQHFPALRTLFLSDEYGFLAPAVATPHNLHGAQLEWLVIAEPFSGTLLSALLCGDNAVNVPNVEYMCDGVQWTESLWRRTNDGTFSIRMSASCPNVPCHILIYIIPEHRRWYRTYDLLQYLSYVEFPLSDLPGVNQRLTYFRMDNHYVTTFLSCGVFEALEVIHLDFRPGGAQSSMVWPPDWIDTFDGPVSFDASDGSSPTFANESYSYVECPSLKTLRLFAMYTQMSVACQEVGYLGRALSQCTRPEENRAALELHGVALGPNIQCGLLEEAYSAVAHHEFSGRHSPAGTDRGLWDVAYSCPLP